MPTSHLIRGWVITLLFWGAGEVHRCAGEEPTYRAKPSLPAAREYLEKRATWWLSWKTARRDRDTSCLSCHTTVPYVLTWSKFGRDALRPADGAGEKLLASVRQRVQNWAEIKPYEEENAAQSRGTESILNTLTLAQDDAAAGRKEPSEETRRSIAQLWALQSPAGERRGAWEWFDYGLAPWESNAEYHGAALAAYAVAIAPGYLDCASDEDHKQIELLRRYLRTGFARQNLHQRLIAVWSSARFADLLSEDERQQVVQEALSKQNADGGWSADSLGDWQRRNGKPHPASSDGYATALIVATLKITAQGAERQAIERGAEWLRRHQSADDGSWPAESLNKDYPPDDDAVLFMRDAATGWAVLALSE